MLFRPAEQSSSLAEAVNGIYYCTTLSISVGAPDAIVVKVIKDCKRITFLEPQFFVTEEDPNTERNVGIAVVRYDSNQEKLRGCLAFRTEPLHDKVGLFRATGARYLKLNPCVTVSQAEQRLGAAIDFQSVPVPVLFGIPSDGNSDS